MEPTYREEPIPADVDSVKRITRATGFFRDDEVAVAAELVEERLARGTDSGYYFWFADIGDRLAGYVCYGPTPCTIGSFDLYWIVVDNASQGLGLGASLACLAERSAAGMDGRRMYVETSGKELYRPTQAFYEKIGYVRVATLPDFYDLGDAKIIYHKNLPLDARTGVTHE